MEKPTPITKEYVKYLAFLSEEQLQFVKDFPEEEKKEIRELYKQVVYELTPEEFEAFLTHLKNEEK